MLMLKMLVSTLLLLVLGLPNIAVADFQPGISRNEFKYVKNILYFDDSSVLLLRDTDKVYISDNDGRSWTALELTGEDGKELEPSEIYQVDFDNQLSFILTLSNRQFYTRDQGKNWLHFDLPIEIAYFGTVEVNYANHDYILFSFTDCKEDEFMTSCQNFWYYSNDGLATDPIRIERDNLDLCKFTKNNKHFIAGADSNIMCALREYDAFSYAKSSALVSSEDFFNSMLISSGGEMENAYILDFSVVKSFIVATIQTDRYTANGLIDFYVSKDAVTFKKAYFEQQFRNWMYTILPSTPNSLHLAVYGAKNSRDPNPAADIYQSSSDGLFFDKVFGDVYSNMLGTSLINKIEEIDGVWILSHSEGIGETGAIDSKSKVSFNDGKTWSDLRIVDDDKCQLEDGCSLNLLWLAEKTGDGKTVTGPTPGILVGIGSTGKILSHNYNDYHTYVSRDGGLTWKKVRDEACVFAFGDLGNIIITMPVSLNFILTGDMDLLSSTLSYSFDQGDSWADVDIGNKVMPVDLLTPKDGTSQHFVMVGLDADRKSYSTYSFDFSDAFKRTCGKNDMEEWYARVDFNTSAPICVYGHVEKFIRRKQNAECFVNQLYRDIEVIEEPCACTIDDSECAEGFSKNMQDVCEPIPQVLYAKHCGNGKKEVKVSSRRMIPGNPCITKDSYSAPQDDYTLSCPDNEGAIDYGKGVRTTFSPFNEEISLYFYLAADPEEEGIPDETLIVLTRQEKFIYISYDGGVTFTKPYDLTDAEGLVTGVYTNQYFPNNVYIFTSDNKIYVSTDRAITFQALDAPTKFSEDSKVKLTFNKDNSTTFIIYHQQNCPSIFAMDCKVDSYVTVNGGKDYQYLTDSVSACRFLGSIFNEKNYDIDPNLIVCDQRSPNGPALRLISSTDYFKSDPEVVFADTIGSTETGEFLIVARLNSDNTLTAFVTADGSNYAEVKFPVDFNVDKQTAYTILEVRSKQVFMHVTTSAQYGKEYGALLKSNFNGTLYVKSIDHVNRNGAGYVDFESIQSLDGIVLLNTISNADGVKDNGESKRLKTQVTYDDGAQWSYLTPPAVDSDNKKYDCKSKSLDSCSLNFHSFTERIDPARDTYSSGSAIGMMFALGNVGPYLKPKDDSSTALYFTRDAGITWKEVKKGNFMWEFGDQGTILVIVDVSDKTDTIYYSLDEGDTWKYYKFSEDPVKIYDLATVPSDTAFRFLLLSRSDDNQDSAYTLDFSNIPDRQCYLDLDNKARKDDFEYWTPKHPFQGDNCLFGHEAKYLRRLRDRTDCFIGAAPLFKGYEEVRNCACARTDFECDYNYVLGSDGTCRLVDGLKPVDAKQECSRDPELTEYWEPTGYRKVPLSTCQGGIELDKWISLACPGRQSQYDKEHGSGIRGFGLFMVIFAPLSAFLFSTWFVYDKGIRRNGGFSRFGEIRLDDDDDLHLIEENNVDIVVNKIVMFGVYSFGFLASIHRSFSAFLKRGLFSRFRSGSADMEGYSRFGNEYNDRIVDTEDDSLFRYNSSDDDAREIDSFLEHGMNSNDIQDIQDDDDDLENFDPDNI